MWSWATNPNPSTGEGKLADPRGSLLSANLKEIQAPGSEREMGGGGGREVELPPEHPGLKYKVEKSLRKIPCQPCQVSTSDPHR